jgi:hypothetical protein
LHKKKSMEVACIAVCDCKVERLHRLRCYGATQVRQFSNYTTYQPGRSMLCYTTVFLNTACL